MTATRTLHATVCPSTTTPALAAPFGDTRDTLFDDTSRACVDDATLDALTLTYTRFLTAALADGYDPTAYRVMLRDLARERARRRAAATWFAATLARRGLLR